MEGPQKPNLSLEDQANLARKLYEATEKRNTFSVRYPDWDDMIVFVNASPENRASYDKIEKEANEARAKLDESVPDKKALVEHLRSVGEDEAADRITLMFNVK